MTCASKFENRYEHVPREWFEFSRDIWKSAGPARAKGGKLEFV